MSEQMARQQFGFTREQETKAVFKWDDNNFATEESKRK